MQTGSDNQEQLLGLLGATSALVAVFDPEDRLRFANEAFRTVFFVDPDECPTWEEIFRRNHAAGRGTVIATPNIDGWIASIGSRRGKTRHRSFESDIIGGKWLWVTETVQSNGWMLLVASDITSVSSADRKLRIDRDIALKAAQTDELTGISNRRHIFELLQQACDDKDAHPQTQICACLMDIDHFKSINDTWGHQAGDDVLRKLARSVRSGIRLKDGFGRVGGEEFLLILKDCSLKSAQKQLIRLMNRISSSSLMEAHPEVTLTMSAGLTDIRAGDTTESIYGRSDRALYEAKAKGRDCICINIHDRISLVPTDTEAESPSADRKSGIPWRAA
ncbi:GGDEF domain-containing protein [Hoeflea sp.]|uniref:GGDEF domain-containing protein n=1 Tax=Hoeflea sp. TaxID=1940281 RepID=UPI003B520EA8